MNNGASKKRKLDSTDLEIQQTEPKSCDPALQEEFESLLAKYVGDPFDQLNHVDKFLTTNLQVRFNLNAMIQGTPALFILMRLVNKQAALRENLKNYLLLHNPASFDWNQKVENEFMKWQTPLMRLCCMEQLDAKEFSEFIIQTLLISQAKLDWSCKSASGHSALDFLSNNNLSLIKSVILSCESLESLNNLNLLNNVSVISPLFSRIRTMDNEERSLINGLCLIYPSLMTDSSIKFNLPSGLEYKLKGLAIEFWHYTQAAAYRVGSNGDAELYILQKMFETTFAVELSGLTKETRERFSNWAAHYFQGYQPTEIDKQIAYKWEKESSSNEKPLAREARAATSVLAVAAYRAEQPAASLCQTDIRKYNRLHREAVERALTDLQAANVLPPILTLSYRNKIVKIVAEIKDDFTRTTVAEKLERTFKK